jgi:hypothetical protein
MTEPWFVNTPERLVELEEMLRARFPTMHAFIEDRQCRVSGTLTLVQDGCAFDRYQIDVVLPEDYPMRPPRVWEIGGRIPRKADRHIFLDGALCLGTPLALWVTLNGDFRLERVLDIPVRNFLIGNSLVEQGDRWPNGERTHGAAGLIEHLAELLGTDKPMMVATFLQALAAGGVTKHSPCPCVSGRKILKCHLTGFKQLRRIPADVIDQTAQLILQELEPCRLAA